MIFFNLCLLATGFAGLVFGANLLVNGSMGLAKNYKWPTLWVGTVLVGFATTIPEMIVSLIAAIKGHAHIAIGNAIGSYVANIGMVLGLTAMVQPLLVHKQFLKKELPLLTASVVLLTALIIDYQLSLFDGIILLLGLITFLWLISKNNTFIDALESDEECSTSKAYFMFFIGTIILWAAGEAMVSAAAILAKSFGMSEWAIGLTIVAVGTSLPELAASIISVKKGHHDLAIGNVVGSNVLGLLGVIAIPSILSPGSIPANAIKIDIISMFIITAIFWLVTLKNTGKKTVISRIEGMIMFMFFLIYLILVA